MKHLLTARQIKLLVRAGFKYEGIDDEYDTGDLSPDEDSKVMGWRIKIPGQGSYSLDSRDAVKTFAIPLDEIPLLLAWNPRDIEHFSKYYEKLGNRLWLERTVYKVLAARLESDF